MAQIGSPMYTGTHLSLWDEIVGANCGVKVWANFGFSAA
jgi:hypothetical protein